MPAGISPVALAKSLAILFILCVGFSTYAFLLYDRPKGNRGLLYALLISLAIVGFTFAAAILIAMTLLPKAVEASEIDGHGGLGQVLVTEIAWAGTHASHYDEWFEIYNASDQPMYLMDTNGDGYGWELLFSRLPAGSDYSRIQIPPVVLQPGEYALFERTDDDAIPNRAAKATFSGGIPNTDVAGFLLVDGNSILQHSWNWYVDDGSTSWPEGSNTSKATAHYFIGGETWTTSNYSTGARDANNTLIFGSPGEENNAYWFSHHSYLPLAIASEAQEE